MTDELEAAVERVTARLAGYKDLLIKRPDCWPGDEFGKGGGAEYVTDLEALLHALAEANERASLLRDTVRTRCAERDEARARIESAAKYLVRLENAMLKDDLDMKLDFPGEEGPSAFAQTIMPGFDPVAYELEMAADRRKARNFNPHQEGSRDHGK